MICRLCLGPWFVRGLGVSWLRVCRLGINRLGINRLGISGFSVCGLGVGSLVISRWECLGDCHGHRKGGAGSRVCLDFLLGLKGQCRRCPFVGLNYGTPKPENGCKCRNQPISADHDCPIASEVK